MRLLVAFTAQPLAAALIAFAIFPIIEWTSRWLDGGRLVDPFGAALSVAAGAGVVAVFVVPLAALPAFAWLMRRGPITRRRVLVSGAMLGNAPIAAIVGLDAIHAVWSGDTQGLARVTRDALGIVRASAFASFVGLACAFVFWLMIRRYVTPAPAGAATAL
jgi:hypothetical protein